MNKRASFCIAMTILVLVGGVALGQGSAGFSLRWNAIPSGGGRSASAVYVVDGSVAQPVVGPASGAGYSLGAGFWCGIADSVLPPPGHPRLYLPVLTRDS